MQRTIGTVTSSATYGHRGAVVRFRPVLGPHFSELGPDRGSGSDRRTRKFNY